MGKKLTQEEIIKRFEEVHKDKYIYSKVSYSGINNKIIIICPEHGEFLQTPYNHYHNHGCPKCATNYNYSTLEIINDFKKIHKYKYNYSKVKYLNNNNKIEIICPEHGSFWQLPYSHRIGNGCPKCQYLNNFQVIERFKKVHGDKYDYSKVNYKNTLSKVEIGCPVHGKFLQTVVDHFSGSGCPKCAKEIKESKGERKIREILEKNNIKYSQEVKLFENYRFDFYLDEFNLIIEYDGIQHFEPVKYFGGEEGFLNTQKRDKIKTEYCKNNKITILRIPYWDFNNINNIINSVVYKNKQNKEIY
jgi:very-short-patch-repair endonuclease